MALGLPGDAHVGDVIGEVHRVDDGLLPFVRDPVAVAHRGLDVDCRQPPVAKHRLRQFPLAETELAAFLFIQRFSVQPAGFAQQARVTLRIERADRQLADPGQQAGSETFLG